MRALHIVKENPSKNSEDLVISESKLEAAYVKLNEYLDQVKETKGQIGFEAHEEAVTCLVYTLGQAALSDVLTHYDTKTDVISVGEQTVLSQKLLKSKNAYSPGQLGQSGY